MTAKLPKTWPNLDLDRLPGLDYLVLEIMAEDLRYAASLVETLFQHPSARGIGEVLRRFADTPRAIKYANHPGDHHTPNPILGLWRALHYLVTAELHPKVPRGKLLGIVADIWDVNDRTIEADVGKHGRRAKQILQSMVEDRFNHAATDRSQVIAALDRDLKMKATQEPKRGVGKTKKSARKKANKVARKK